MEVIIKLKSVLKRYAKTEDGIVKIAVDEGTTIKQVIETFNIMNGEAELVILNSKLANEEAVLKEGDIVELYPVMGGG